jgi:putative flippase GtrA
VIPSSLRFATLEAAPKDAASSLFKLVYRVSDTFPAMPTDERHAGDVLVEEPLRPVPGRRPMDIARRTVAGATKPHNWIQLVKFGAVGGTGYVVNLIVFGLLAEGLGVHHLIAAVGAFAVAVTNNFLLNRHWTFAAGAGDSGFQGPRFFIVSLGSLVINLVVLQALVTAGDLSELPAQAIAVAVAMPFNYIGNKVWTFSWETLE